jgi:hypothetical protein
LPELRVRRPPFSSHLLERRFFFDAPTAADYAAGRIEAHSPLPFQIATTSEPAGSFTTTVYIRSSLPSLGGGISLADMEVAARRR